MANNNRFLKFMAVGSLIVAAAGFFTTVIRRRRDKTNSDNFDDFDEFDDFDALDEADPAVNEDAQAESFISWDDENGQDAES